MIPATGISVTPDSLEISEGATAQLSVELTPPDSTDATSYESDAPSIASVSESGIVTAVAQGSANITVSAGDQSAVCAVTVAAPEMVTITINPTPAEAVVRINGSEQKSIEVVKGSQVSYEVSAEGYSPESGSVMADQTKTVDVTLNKIQVTVTINPTPADATVMIGGEQKNSTTVDYGTEVSYEVSKEGYISKSGSVNATSDQTVEVSLEAVVLTQYQMSSDAPATATVSEEVSANVTISVKTAGNTGYNKVQFQFDSQRPEGANMTFKATDSQQQESTFQNNGTWGPPEGFAIPADYSATTLFKVSADKPGTYTVNYKLVNLEDSSTICEASESIEITE